MICTCMLVTVDMCIQIFHVIKKVWKETLPHHRGALLPVAGKDEILLWNCENL